MKSGSNKLVVVLTPGRTGSSLLTRILMAMGMAGSNNFLEGVEFNPEGVFEDTDIVTVHKELFAFLEAHPYAPLTDESLNKENIGRYIRELQDIVQKNIASTDDIWGFKDPRTASLLPIWSRVFNPLKLAPKYVVSTRNPSAVVNSLHRQFNDSHEVAELVWLVRTCDALYYSGGYCCIVHYEDWFTDTAPGLANDLAVFVGLNDDGKNENVNQLLSGILNKSLDRSGIEKYEIKNPLVNELYAALKECRGSNFDHARLMEKVIECRNQISHFTPFISMGARVAQNNYRNAQKRVREVTSKNSLLREEHSRLQTKVDELSKNCLKLETDNSALTSKLVTQIKDIGALQDEKSKLAERSVAELKNRIELENNFAALTAQSESQSRLINSLNKKVKAQDRNISQRDMLIKKQETGIRKLKADIVNLQSSVSFRIGQTFVMAIARPGKHTILFPYYFLKAVLEGLFPGKDTGKKVD